MHHELDSFLGRSNARRAGDVDRNQIPFIFREFNLIITGDSGFNPEAVKSDASLFRDKVQDVR
jgi:hypothetical protein